MFNSFLDGTKSALEMAAVANGCDLSPPSDGLEFPPCGAHHLPTVLRPKADGGHLEKKGTVEVVSSLELDGRTVFNDLRFGVFVVIEGKPETPKPPPQDTDVHQQHQDPTKKTASNNTASAPTAQENTPPNTNPITSSASNSESQ